MILYFLITLVSIGTLWLVIVLSLKALRIWISRRESKKTAQRVASRVVDAELEPGGKPDNPIPIQTPSVVEAKASEYRCPFCDAEMRVQTHRAVEHHGRRLRTAEIQCMHCEYQRNIYFELRSVN